VRRCRDAGSWTEEQAEHWWRDTPPVAHHDMVATAETEGALDCADLEERCGLTRRAVP